MYQIPKKMNDFDIALYFGSASEFYDLIHPDWPFLKSEAEREQLETLLRGVEKSLSLNRFEKMRIVTTKLCGFQVSELIKVFTEEASQFIEFMDNDAENVFNLAVRARNDWMEHLLPELVTGPGRVEDDDKLTLLNAMMLIVDKEGTPGFP
jgi:hypothetical protein